MNVLLLVWATGAVLAMCAFAFMAARHGDRTALKRGPVLLAGAALLCVLFAAAWPLVALIVVVHELTWWRW